MMNWEYPRVDPYSQWRLSMHWSVEEQTVPTAPLHIKSINLRVDPSSSHVMLMELLVDEDPPLIGYVLKFNRNGAFIVAEKVESAPVEPPPVEPPPEAAREVHSSHGKPKK
jgi:hypothetical protein